jgi:predicted RNA-binding Zn-ribbon protein involved in translation (DUF1610 family)
MTPQTCIDQFALRGIRLWAEGDGLKYEAPAGALTPDLREMVASCRGELIALLRQVPAACPKCGGRISSVTSADRASELFGCHDSCGEHWYRRLFYRPAPVISLF